MSSAVRNLGMRLDCNNVIRRSGLWRDFRMGCSAVFKQRLIAFGDISQESEDTGERDRRCYWLT